MRIEHRPSHAPLRRAGHAYFVGRRPSDEVGVYADPPEVYAVTSTDVQRLESSRRYGVRSLDWRGNSRAVMELSHVLLSLVAGLRSSRDLDERFALYVIAHLPEGGFVLDSKEVWRWLRLASEPHDFEPARHSVARRLRTLFGGTPVPSADG
jgi:hypothetical protein